MVLKTILYTVYSYFVQGSLSLSRMCWSYLLAHFSDNVGQTYSKLWTSSEFTLTFKHFSPYFFSLKKNLNIIMCLNTVVWKPSFFPFCRESVISIGRWRIVRSMETSSSPWRAQKYTPAILSGVFQSETQKWKRCVHAGWAVWRHLHAEGQSKLY